VQHDTRTDTQHSSFITGEHHKPLTARPARAARSLIVGLSLLLASCAQHDPNHAGHAVTLTSQSASYDAPATLGDRHSYSSGGARWWSDGARWWSDAAQWWSEGARWWSDGARWWSDGVFAPVPGNSAAFRLIRLDAVRDLSPRMGTGTVVAVIDTGVDPGHPMLRGSLRVGYDYIAGRAGATEAGTDADAAYGHGTAVAGLIRQVAPGATILPMRVIGPDGSGNDTAVVQAIKDAVSQGAHVINLSISVSAPTSGVRAALVDAAARGVLVVASSGNDGASQPQSPARQMSQTDSTGLKALSVGAVDVNGIRTAWSNDGAEVLAPGVSLTTAYPGNRLVNATGTSFSTPLVAATLALALAEGASPEDLAETLRTSTTKGVLDAAAFLQRLPRTTTK